MNLESNLNNSKNNILFPTVKSTISKTNRLEELKALQLQLKGNQLDKSIRQSIWKIFPP